MSNLIAKIRHLLHLDTKPKTLHLDTKPKT